MTAKIDGYKAEAYDELERISRDRAKKIEYTSRQKAIMDHNTIMEERYEKGRAEGRAEGIKELVVKWRELGKSEEEIFKLLH